MQSFLRFCRTGMLLLCCFTAALFSKAQTTSNYVSGSGFGLQEIVSLSSPLSGQPFMFTVNFTIPGGASNFDIIAYLPPANILTIDTVYSAANYGGSVPTVTRNPISNEVRMHFSTPVTGTVLGSFQINTHFPYLGACNRSIKAHAEIKGDSPPVSLVTSDVVTSCVVNKTWYVQKYSRGTTYVGPQPGSSCNYATLDSVVEYGIKMVPTWGAGSPWGSYTLTNPQLFDTPPLSGTITGITYTTPTLAGTSLIAGGFGLVMPLTPGVLDPTQYYEVRFKVHYSPTLPNNTCILNAASLTGKNGCGDDVEFHDTARVVKLVSLPGNARLIKQVFPDGNLPGCGGTYRIYVFNYGSDPINYHLTDTLPPCLTAVTAGLPPAGGSSVSLIGGIASMNGVNLAGFGAYHLYTFHYTIGPGCYPGFTNTVYADSGFIATSSAHVAMLPPEAKPCLMKSICAVPGNIIHIGDTVRFRIRVQNIGGTPITSAIVRDSLDEANLEYIGNEMHYTFPNAANIGCRPAYTVGGAQPWGPFSNGTQTPGAVTWNIAPIGVECDNILNPVCGAAYYLPAYYIEFDVRVRDTAGIGNILNKAIITGGNVGPDVSAFTSFLSNGLVNCGVQKLVSKDNSVYTGNISVPAGSTVYYKLIATNTGIAIRDAVLVDLLPKDRAAGDSMILPSGLRSPAPSFNIRYNGAVSSTYATGADSSSTNVGISTMNELGATTATGPAGWTPGLSVNAADIKTKITLPIGFTPLNYIFSAKISASAEQDQVACNTYAIRGKTKHLTNYVANLIALPAAESPKACVTSTGGDPCCEPYAFVIPRTVCVGDSIKFCVKDSCKEGDIKYEWHFNDGGPLQTGECISHVFAAEGTYALVIVWQNKCGVGHSEEYIIEAKKCCCEPYEFVIPEKVCLGTAAQFCVKDSCKEGDIVYYWHFGDGSPVVKGECVTHAYSSPGSYTVVVTWKNKCGEGKSKEYKIEVKECECKITVAFTLTTSGLHLLADGSSTVSSQPIALYVWDYGDGTYGTGAVSNHTYSADGEYVVTLTVYSMNSKGEICDCRDKCSTRIRVVRRDRESRRWYCGERSVPEEGKKADEITMNATPNPFRDRISISFVTAKADPKVKVDPAAQAYTLTFLGTDGTVMQTRSLSGLRSTVTFQTAHYSAGMYYLMLTGSDGKVRSVKVVKID